MISDFMASDPGICCFQHCGPKIFCLKLPKNCPACNSDLTKAEFAFVPFRYVKSNFKLK